MRIVHILGRVTDEERSLPTIFLAGPTPQDECVEQWRSRALKLLDANNFQGVVINPELLDEHRYDGNLTQPQATWIKRQLGQAKVILFWFPSQPSLASSCAAHLEWGRWTIIKSDRIVLGYPLDAPETGYLYSDCGEFNIPVFHTLEETVQAALTLAAKQLP